MAVKTTPNSLDDDVVQHADVLNGSANDMEDPTCQETARMISLESIQVPALGETPYFDVETEQVKNKMLHALFGSHTKNSFWSTSSDESGIQDSDIDLMGPLWITLMVAFLFGAMASSWASYKYGNPSWILLVVYSVLIFSAYTVGIPATLQCFNSNPPRPSSPHFSMAPWIYLYGYSLVSFIPAIVIWAFLTVLFSSTLLDAALVLIPTILSAAFVLQNAPMISPLDFPRRCILGVTHLIFLSSLWGLFVTPPSPPGFDFYVLAMTYQPEFCNFPAPCAYPGPQETFSLHGLWPEWKNGTWPSTCSTDPLIDSTIRRVGLKRMEKYWPDLKSEYGNGKKYASLWEHEWSKHGTCSGLSQDVYLSVTLDNDLRMPRKVRRSIGGSIDKWELIQAFGGRNKVVTVCSRGASLTEIRVCLAADRLGYPTRRIQCPRFVLEQDNCKNADVFLRGV